MRFDYPVLVLINTNVINGHKKRVDSVRLILSRVAPRCPLEAPAPRRGLWPVWVTGALRSPPHPLPLLSVPPGLPRPPPRLLSLIIKSAGFPRRVTWGRIGPPCQAINSRGCAERLLAASPAPRLAGRLYRLRNNTARIRTICI